MRHYRKTNVSHFGHVSANKRPVSMKATPGIGELAQGTSDDEEFNKQMIKRLKDAGEIIAEYARLTSGAFSSRIPMSLEVKNDDKSVYILGGGHAAPNAYPFDPPNNPPVYHPVHAHGPRSKWAWAAQPYRPFLEEAAELGGNKAAEAFAEIINDWAKEIGTDRP